MNDLPLAIQPFDFRSADEAAHAAYNDYHNIIRAEQLPDDGPRSLRRAMSEWQNLPDTLDYWLWLAVTAEGAVAASSRLRVEHGEHNQHLAFFDVNVAPVWRGRGLAKRLLRPVAEKAEKEGRRLLLARTSDRVPAGADLMRRMGARVAINGQVNQLDLRQVNRSLLRAWQAIGVEEYGLEFWEAPYAGEGLAAMAALQSMVQNEQPRGDMEIEKRHVTPGQMQKITRFLTSDGRRLWSLHAHHKVSGRPVGGTVVQLDPEQPTIVQQLYTGVYPEFRRRGLARWLKAEMMQKILADWPTARFVRTDNAASNAAMLKINEELGFRLYYKEMLWHVETDRLRAYLLE